MASEKSKPLIRAVSPEKGQPIYKILIVDDHEDNRNLLFKLLKPFSFELSKAENGNEAVEIWKKCLPDLIWMDIKMPVMDGYEAVKIIRKSEKDNLSNKRCIIIAQTASVLEEDRNLILKAGCDDFMRKPFKETEIFEMMHKHPIVFQNTCYYCIAN